MAHYVAILVVNAAAEVVDQCEEHPNHAEDDDGEHQQKDGRQHVVAAYLGVHPYIFHNVLVVRSLFQEPCRMPHALPAELRTSALCRSGTSLRRCLMGMSLRRC